MQAVYSSKEKCSGCSACYSICPQKAISMEADKEGFLYPVIDHSVCTNCELCRKVCPFIEGDNYKYGQRAESYVAQHKSEAVLKHSTSGGVFTALSDTILKRKGVVYGADFDENLKVVHKAAQTAAERNKMRLSKYVQSEMKECFSQLKKDLKNGYSVLFTGTPCQTAGIRAYIGSSSLRENLYICDLICHSIPSPLIWEEYKKMLEREKGSKLKSVQFRSKKYDWGRKNSNKGFLYSVKGSSKIYEDDRFFELFIERKTIARPSCSKCPFTDTKRASDLTIADYFGIKKYDTEWYDSLGVSLVLVNSAKGKKLFEQSAQDLYFEERPLKEAVNEQQRLSKAVELPEDRDDFWEDFRKYGLEYVLK